MAGDSRIQVDVDSMGPMAIEQNTEIIVPPDSENPSREKQAVGAEKPSDKTPNFDAHALSLCFFSFLTISLVSGLVYGFPSLRRQLVSKEESDLDERTLGIIYTVGAWTTQSSRFFYGLARDRYLGTRITTCISILAAAVGCFGIAFASPDDGLVLSISMFFVGMGSGSQLCLQPVAGLFRKNVQGLVLASFSGAFQVAGLVFVALTAITTDRQTAFASFAGLLIALSIAAAFVLPARTFEPNKTTKEVEHHDSPDEVTGEESPKSGKHISQDTDNNQGGGSDDGIDKAQKAQNLQGSSNLVQSSDSNVVERNCDPNDAEAKPPQVTNQLKSAEYIALIAWFSVIIIPLQYYIGTIGFQLERRGDDDGKFTRIFSIVYASAAAFSPILGKLADSAGLGVAQSLATILTAISLFMLASRDISLNVHAFGMSLYGLGRMMAFGCFFTNIGKRFGYANYGTLSGLGLLLSGLASLVQYPLITVASDGHDSAINIGCGIALICLLPYCLWLGLRERAEMNS